MRKQPGAERGDSAKPRRRRAARRERLLLTLIDRLYAAAVDESQWQGFLEPLTRATDSTISFFMVHDVADQSGLVPWMWGVDEGSQREYPQWAPMNPIINAAAPLAETGRLFPNSIVPPKEMWNTQFYNDYAGRYFRFRDVGGICVVQQDGLTAFLSQCRAPDRRDYAREDWELWEALSPHLQRAVTIHRRLGNLELERNATEQALDSLSAAVLLLDERGRVMLHNRAAQEILDANDGVSLSRTGELRVWRSSESSLLRRLIGEACAAGAGHATGSGGGMAFARPSGRRAYGAVVSPLRLRRFALMSHLPAAVVFVVDPEQEIPPAQRLAEVFGLTPAESQVATLLAQGRHVSEIVDLLGVTTATVRTHVRNALDKTGADGQIDLVRLVAGILQVSGRG